MTGFGKGSAELEDKTIHFEIKSLNSKQLDLYFRFANGFREMEMEMRNEIVNRLKRGKIECSISIEYKEGRHNTRINEQMLRLYYSQVASIMEDMQAKHEPVLQAIMRLPEVISNDREVTPDGEWLLARAAFQSAIDQVEQYRISEGQALEKDIASRIGKIEGFLNEVSGLEPERLAILKSRLNTSLHEAIGSENLDMNRFEQELIYYIEKTDITEEQTRLKHHCRYFGEVMAEPGQVGRKLGFVAQEVGREINTIGSKANHAQMQKLVVLMKDELEKIKEQLMNVL